MYVLDVKSGKELFSIPFEARLPEKAIGEFAETWFPGGKRPFVPHVRQAFSLVPNECIAFRRLSAEMYIDNKDMGNYSAGRTLTRPQMELLAARTSLLNECFY